MAPIFKQMDLKNAWMLTHLPLDKMATILADDIFKYIFFNEMI